jgi:hypothetical protein
MLTPREANIFACLTDAAVAPVAPLPPVGKTDAVEAFARYLEGCPPPNRLVLRAALLLLELLPRVLGFGARMRTLSRAQRSAYLEQLENGRLESLVKSLRGVAQLSYYGDERIMRMLGYDAEAVVQRGRALREQEGRW